MMLRQAMQLAAIGSALLPLAACQSVQTQTGFAASADIEKTGQWRSLFDGKTLNDWFLVYGDKPFEVENGEIVGETAVGITNRYLTTKQRFGDFILELEVNNSHGDNSGIQFRSVTDASFYAGLTGYQLEIDHSPRQWTGGIYFEGLGEWRASPEGNTACMAAWQRDGWNTLRIEAHGQMMRSFVNDTPCVQLFDDWIDEGHIGLQIHGIGQEQERAGKITRWRNIRIIDRPAPQDYHAQAQEFANQSFLKSGLSAEERATGWRQIDTVAGNGRAWHPGLVRNPISGAHDAAPIMQLAAGDEVQIPLDQSAYHLIADMQITPGTRGQILYPVNLAGDDGSLQKCTASYRIFDDLSLEVRPPDDPMLMGSLTSLIASRNLSFDGPKYVRLGDAWHRLEIVSGALGVEHWLNSAKVVAYSGCEGLTPGNDAKLTIRIDSGAATILPLKLRGQAEVLPSD